MHTAKIIRHRHAYHHFINDHLVDVKDVVYYKIIFSDPAEMEAFEKWCEDNGGKYLYDKDNSCQAGEMPKLDIFKGDDICWCDLMTYYLCHVTGYSFYSTIHPYKGEVYVHYDTNYKTVSFTNDNY